MAVVTTYKTVESLGTNHAGATTKAGEFISDFGNGSFAPTTLLEVQTIAGHLYFRTSDVLAAADLNYYQLEKISI